MEISNRRDLFIKINKAVLNCGQCRLCRTRINAIPGEGNITSKLIFLGEAPSSEEDSMGRPFIGKSGMLLNELIAKIGYNRREVWIGNLIKCHPPENRDPMVDEIRACSPYIDKQIDIIKPKVVVTIGRLAMEYYLPGKKLGEEHGKAFRVKNFIVFPVYHPSGALRNPAIKNILVSDFAKIPGLLKKDINEIAFFNKGKKSDINVGISLF
ncbi:uracil-DNA glycosylase [bacterium]|nr:uracil-DNA glycosylase [bacterium]